MSEWASEVAVPADAGYAWRGMTASRELQRAREHCFVAGVGDAAMQLCEANVPFGLAKIQHVQRQLGLPADASFVGSPDATVTRNTNRWRQGFGYGGIYEWTGDFHVLDLKVNACGMLVGALPRLPEERELGERMESFAGGALELDGVPLENDLASPNHFVDVFELAEEDRIEAPPGDARYFFIMHSSGHEHRVATPRGIGLYWDKSEELVARAQSFETPWGLLRILADAPLREWMEFYRFVQDFNHRRRELLASHLFGEYTSLINATHQGLVRGANVANIGCYTFDDSTPEEERLFPLTLSPQHPAYLVRGWRNLSDHAIDSLGWRERAERHGLVDRLRSANMLPHGGGYSFPHLAGPATVEAEAPDRRSFALATGDPAAPREVISDPRGLSFGYRGQEVRERMEALDLGRAVVRLELRYVLGG